MVRSPDGRFRTLDHLAARFRRLPPGSEPTRHGVIHRAQSNSRALGFILLALYGLAGSPYIASIGVSPDAQGQGIGSQLMQFTEQHFRDRSHLFLLVSSFNSRAQRFYHRHGYECIGELTNYIVAGHSELIFHKRLA
jgi:ribosomal protein S18 acetylase RimI-like enzyme